MATELILPRVDMDMTEGKIAHWYVKNGDSVSKGQVVFEIETDKATMEIDAPESGIVQGIAGKIGTTLPVGQTVGWILQPGEALPVIAQSKVPASPSSDDIFPAEVATPSVAVEIEPDGAQLRATPLARSLAREQGIDLRAVKGSGPDGRVRAGDLPTAAASAKQSSRSSSAAGHGLHLHWFNKGAGVPVVLLHGFGTSLGSWRLLAEELDGLAVAGIDLPNHGKSPRFATPDMACVAESVLQRLDLEGIGALHLVGHSMGGSTALAMSGLLGARLRSLTLISPAGLGPEINGAFVQGLIHANREESLRPWLAELFGEASCLTASFVATAWRELESAERRQALAVMADGLLPDGTQAESLRDQLQGLTVPVKVIWGTLDRIVPIRHSARLPGAVALHTLAGVGHLPQVEAVALVASLVRQQVGAAESAKHGIRR